MKHVILEAMKRLREYEGRIGRKVPKPTYLLVQRYGRTLEPALRETAEAFGKKQSFLLRKDVEMKDGTLLEKLVIEAQKRADMGKRFEGLVVIELTGAERKEEREAVYEYIKQNTEEIACVFTVRSEDAADDLYQELEQHFPFVRKVSEECYGPEEQKEILAEALEKGGIALTKAEQDWVEERLAKVKWSPVDHVENRLKNLANNLVYEQIMSGASLEPVSVDNLRDAFKQLEEPAAEKISIGFAPPKEKEPKGKTQERDGKEMVA